jgi:CRP-like cAMP-binding protein
MDPTNVKNALRQLDFCREMDDADLSRLASIAGWKEYQRGEVLFREGESADEVYLIVQGEVGLSVFGPHLGHRHLASVGAGELVGWSPILERTRMSDTARAMAPTQVVIVPGGKLIQLCYENPAFGVKFMHRTALTVAERLSAARLQMLDLCGVRLPVAALESD